MEDQGQSDKLVLSPEEEPSALEQILAESLDRALLVDEAWGKVKSYYASSFNFAEQRSEEVLRIAVAVTGIGDIHLARQNRDLRRKQTATTQKYSKNVENVITNTRRIVSTKGNPELEQVRDIANFEGLLENERLSEDADDMTIERVSDLFSNWVVETYTNLLPEWSTIYLNRRETLANLYGYLSQNPIEFDSYVGFLEEEAESNSPDTQSLLTLLANDFFDKLGDCVFEDFFGTLIQGEVLLGVRTEFLEGILAELKSDSPTESPSAQTIKLLRSIHNGGDQDFVQAMLDNYSLWGKDINEDYGKYLAAYFANRKIRIEKALEPSIRRSQFEQFSGRLTNGQIGNDEQTSTKRVRQKRGRVTTTEKKIAFTPENDKRFEDAHERMFTGYLRCVRITNGGYDLHPLGEDGADAMLMEYALKQDRDPDFIEDLRNMLNSIKDRPVGDGAFTYKDVIIRIAGRRSRLWHLSPNHRKELQLETKSARRARIIYVILGDGQKGFNIALHSIKHHSDNNNLKSGDDY